MPNAVKFITNAGGNLANYVADGIHTYLGLTKLNIVGVAAGLGAGAVKIGVGFMPITAVIGTGMSMVLHFANPALGVVIAGVTGAVLMKQLQDTTASLVGNEMIKVGYLTLAPLSFFCNDSNKDTCSKKIYEEFSQGFFLVL
jgi:hypothetical protein